MKTYQLVLTAGAMLAIGGTGMKTATAKTPQKIVSNRTMTTPAATRNVVPTGRNALYSKAGFMRSKKNGCFNGNHETASKLNELKGLFPGLPDCHD
ncbi:hypothetical protein [Secundilactobacillus kimchicus]|uniref:hypothetical protein n=1 Tax=Secundilactobacillus kimchicus TaxID=528209 RepID=UPI0006CFB0D2|nr:hypothetical protein [Secundilactobacillus kimchicus]